MSVLNVRGSNSEYEGRGECEVSQVFVMIYERLNGFISNKVVVSGTSAIWRYYICIYDRVRLVWGFVNFSEMD